MTAAATAPQQKSAIGQLLDFIEVAGNKVPHPVMMFLYLIIGVIVLSQVLYLAGVSVTDKIVVPVDAAVPPDYYEDTTYPDVNAGDTLDENWYDQGRSRSRSRACSRPRESGSSSRPSSPNFAGFGVVAVTFIALMGAGVAEAGGLMGALIRKLVGGSPKRLLSLILVLVGIMSSVASDAGYLILVPLGAAAFMSRRPASARRARDVLRRRRDGVRRQPDPRPDRRDDHRDHQRGPWRDRRRAAHDRRQLVLHIVSSIVLGVVVALITERMIERRLGPFDGRVAAGGDEEPEVDPAGRVQGPALRALAFLGFVGPRAGPDPPARRPAPRPGDRRHHRHDAVHGQPAVHHRDGFLVSGIAYGAGRGPSRARTRSSRRSRRRSPASAASSSCS